MYALGYSQINEKEGSEKIARIKWACRRGMLELDFILGTFLKTGFLSFNEEQQDAFLVFLEHPDPDLYAWLMGYQKTDTKADNTMIELIRAANSITS